MSMCATKPFSRYYLYQELTPNDGDNLFQLAKDVLNCSKENFPSTLAKSRKENQDLASAYASDKEYYPLSYLVFEKETQKKLIAFVLVERTNNIYNLEVCVGNAQQPSLAALEIAAEICDFFNENFDCDADATMFVTLNDNRANNILNCFAEAVE